MSNLDEQLENRGLITYPKKVRLNPKYKETCENDKIKQENAFYVDKHIQKPMLPTSRSQIKWIVSLKLSKPQLAILKAKRGECNDLLTEKGSRQCGIGKEIMKMCLKDDDIIEDGGYNPMTESSWDDEDLKRTARNVCKAIVLVTCSPYDSTPNIVCKSYMDAAKDSGYHLIFLEKVLEEIKILRYDIETAKSDFVKNADAFIENKGKNWYFCKCKQDRKKDCLGITTIYLYGILFSMEYQGSTSSVLIIYFNIRF